MMFCYKKIQSLWRNFFKQQLSEKYFWLLSRHLCSFLSVIFLLIFGSSQWREIIQPLQNRDAMKQAYISSTFYSTLCKKQLSQSYSLFTAVIPNNKLAFSAKHTKYLRNLEEQIHFEQSFYLCYQCFIFFRFLKLQKQGMQIPGRREWSRWEKKNIPLPLPLLQYINIKSIVICRIIVFRYILTALGDY